MPNATTIRVTTRTRDAVRALADADGLTLDAEISRLARSERQRRMGRELAEADLTADDERWLDVGAEVVGDDAGG